MKKQFILLSFLAVFFCISNASAQLVFGLNTGIGNKTAYFGLKNKSNFLPYASLQFVKASIKNTYDGETTTVSASLIMPTIGTKYYLKNNNKLRPYLDLSISKPLYWINDGEDNLSDLPKIIGGGFGFGTEYFIDPQLSLGGEFGIMYMHAKYKTTDMYYDYYDEDPIEIEDKYKINLNPTYAKLSLNFYFDKNNK